MERREKVRDERRRWVRVGFRDLSFLKYVCKLPAQKCCHLLAEQTTRLVNAHALAQGGVYAWIALFRRHCALRAVRGATHVSLV